MAAVLELLNKEPLVGFAILLAVILIVPVFFERLRLPGLVGLLAAGVLLGPNGLKILNTDSEMMKLLSDIGVVYLLFVAGLEIDIEEFRKTKHRSMVFGCFTFFLPLIVGTVLGRVFGYGWNASILIGSLFASHTPLGYPIVSRLGMVNNPAVIVTIGGTIFTDIGALLVLAICVGIHQGDFSAVKLLALLLSLGVYSALILFGFDWLGREFFRRTGDDEGNQFLFVLLAVFLSAVGAQLIGVEKIVGAFLAGLAVNGAVGSGPVKEKVVFVGSVLFIPIFFVDMGLLIQLPAFVKTLTSIWLTLAIVVGLCASKFLAALLTKLVYRYNWREMLAMFSLSLPQVAATLAATIVGYRVGLLKEDVLNSVIVLMLVTATVGPFITARAAVGLPLPAPDLVSVANPLDGGATGKPSGHAFTVVVPVYNPQTERYLVEMAALLARHEAGRIVALSIAKAHAQMDDSDLEVGLQRSERLVAEAVHASRQLGVAAQPLLRIDDDVAQGICRASREQKASLTVMGWGETTSLRARLFGNVIDSVLWASHCPVAVTRLLDSPVKIRRILVPVDSLIPQAVLQVRFAYVLADANRAAVTLLHVCDRRTPKEVIDQFQSQLSLLVSEFASGSPWEIQITAQDDAVAAILEAARSCDLVILRSVRRRTVAGLEMDDVTAQVVRQLPCSLVMLGEP